MWDEDYAVVFSGGGALGAWEVGCLKYLLEHYEGRLPTVVSGASAGALNAAGLAAGMTVKELEKEWSSLTPEDIFTWKLKLGPLLRHMAAGMLPWNGGASIENLLGRLKARTDDVRSVLDTTPFEDTIYGLLKDREHDFLSSPMRLAISATNLAEGKPELFYKMEPGEVLPEGADKGRYKDCWTNIPSLLTLTQALKGTAALPVLFPPMEGRFDGGVLLNQPLLPAIRLGARNIYVFIPSPEGFGLTDNLTDIAQTLMSTWLATSLTAQIRTVAAYNIVYRLAGEPLVRLCVVRPGIELERDPGVGLLDFGKMTRTMIEYGYASCRDRMSPARFDPENEKTWDGFMDADGAIL